MRAPDTKAKPNRKGADWLPPKVLELKEIFGKLAKASVSDDRIEVLALEIHGRATWIGARTHKIGRNLDGKYYARESVPPSSIIRELLRLQKAAQSRSIKKYVKAWAATRDVSIKLIIAQAPAHWLRDARKVGFTAPGYAIAVPRPEFAMDYISAALSASRAQPGKKSDQAKCEMIESLGRVYKELTGKKPYSFHRGHTGAPQLAGPFPRFLQQVGDLYSLSSLNSEYRLRRLKKAQSRT